ncbi:MAG TPA: polysulfide reductase NrfD [Kiritimatiellia bacterium]|nr:polysulfide reductase NrfD [Kiritimatiellia bacterium]
MSASAPDPTMGRVEIPDVVDLRHTYDSATDKINGVILTKHTPLPIFIALGICLMFAGLLFMTIGKLVTTGIGIWGNNQPVAWAFDIINFVWWIGIGHAGTLISAILFLFRQEWRTSINRFAEAMTIFAVMCAGLFPLLHTGRPWMAYWLFPYPNVMDMFPQFRSPLMWDVFAVSTYFTVSALFWYTGLIPDLASLRDSAKSKVAKVITGIAAMGWRGSARHWQRYDIIYLLLAGISTPLVVSVHSIVSLDFAVSQLPGWHTTIFPPYFVAGAIYSGFAMVLTLAIPVRALFGFKDFITQRHLDAMSKVMLATGLIVLYGYAMEAFIALVYSANPHEEFLMKNRMFGPYAWSYWLLILCNGVIPQLLWLKRVRLCIPLLWVITIVINIGMWLERFVILVTTLHRDFMPSAWGMYAPTKWDIMMFLGTIGLFGTLMCLFLRFVPMIAGFELRELLHKKKSHHH